MAEKDYNYSTLVIISQQLNQQLEAERADRTVHHPDPADLLNQLKGRRKRSRADLADVEAILEILGDCGDE